MKKNRHIVRAVRKGSIAEELQIEPGDEIVRINGEEVEDIFDYQYLIQDEYVEVLLRKVSGEEWLLEVEKEETEDLGAVFENDLMDEYRSCRNRCIFCFIDQMPPGMRETLYFKDDDSRLSFLQGNYVTLTNMSDHDVDRIIRYHLSPINISFHTTNPELRCRMLNNRFAGGFAEKVRRFRDAGVEMNGQIVLCRGINDGEELEKSLGDLTEYFPALRSVSVVPVGLTRYRDGLYPLEPFDRDDARTVLSQIHRWQKRMYEQTGSHFVHASDEWYLLAEEPLPEAEKYDGYLQLENGVGMLRLLEEEVKEELKKRTGDENERKVSIATGRLAAPFIRQLADWLRSKYPGLRAEVFPIVNEFFGERITVSGLVTGRDLIRQLRGKKLGERLLIPCNMLRDGENVFLDDVSVEDVERELQVPVQVTDAGGKDFCMAVLEENAVLTHKRRQMYEQTDCCDCGKAKCGKVHSV